MKIIRLLLKSSKGWFAIAAVSSALTGLFSSWLIKMINESIQTSDFDATAFISQFAVLLAGYGALAIFSSYMVAKLSQGVIHQLRIQIVDKILHADFRAIESNQNKLFPILTEDIRTLQYGIDSLPSVTTGLATVLGVLVYMAWYSPVLTLLIVAVLLVVFALKKLSLPLIKKYQEKSRVLWEDIFKLFEGLLLGIKELSLNRKFKEIYLKDMITPTSKKQNEYLIKEHVVIAVASKVGDMVLLLGIAVLIVFIFKTDFIEPKVFGQYLTLVLFIIAPLTTVANWLNSLKSIEVAMEQIDKAGIDLTQSAPPRQHTPLPKQQGEPIITLENVRHEYYNPDEDEHFELGPINLTLHQGELVFLLGGNGSGKTTLAKVLLGLYTPKAGRVLYYGQAIDSHNQTDYRDKFTATFVDSYLFENVSHLDQAAIRQRGKTLLKTLELTKKVKIEGGEFSTTRLSEGQKKRLGLLNAILKDREIYLFDEWAANQDPHFKKIFYENILQDLKQDGKTIIVISHDEQYFDQGDRVIKLVEGKLVH